MPKEHFRYAYALKSRSQFDLGKEMDAVGNAYQHAGWIEVDFIPSTGMPTHVIFEWRGDGPPKYPYVSYPESRQ